jgi:hypothetical protein
MVLLMELSEDCVVVFQLLTFVELSNQCSISNNPYLLELTGGLATMLTADPHGWRRSAETPRPRRRRAAMAAAEMKGG